MTLRKNFRSRFVSHYEDIQSEPTVAHYTYDELPKESKEKAIKNFDKNSELFKTYCNGEIGVINRMIYRVYGIDLKDAISFSYKRGKGRIDMYGFFDISDNPVLKNLTIKQLKSYDKKIMKAFVKDAFIDFNPTDNGMEISVKLPKESEHTEETDKMCDDMTEFFTSKIMDILKTRENKLTDLYKYVHTEKNIINYYNRKGYEFNVEGRVIYKKDKTI